MVKDPPANVGDGRDLGWEDPLEEARNPLQCYCLENPMDRGAWGLHGGVSRAAQSKT